MLQRKRESSRHRRSTVSLSSSSGLGLIRAITRDLRTGWNSPTSLNSEKRSSSPSPVPSSPRNTSKSHDDSTQPSTRKPYKPRHAGRDALRTCMPKLLIPEPNDSEQDAYRAFDSDSPCVPSSPTTLLPLSPTTRSRQDSVAPEAMHHEKETRDIT